MDLARKVAKSIAAVHEIDGENAVALVHNDINVSNFFVGRKNNPLLNDFNIAVLMMKDGRTNKSCSFPGHFPNPQVSPSLSFVSFLTSHGCMMHLNSQRNFSFTNQWKSPEEQDGPDGNSIGELNEKVDIYALGNLLFLFATGKAPWREMADTKHAALTDEQKKHIAHLKVDGGTMPMVPESTKLKDPYINILLEAMKWCYRFKPEERPTAREAAEFLDKSKKELDQNLVEFGRLLG